MEGFSKMKTKQSYIAPETETILVQTECRVLIDSNLYGDEGKAGGPQSYNRYNDDF